MGELLPTLSGLSLGTVLAWYPPGPHVRTRAFAVLLLGFASFFLNGEFRTSWLLLLVDTLLVALTATVGYLFARGSRRSLDWRPLSYVRGVSARR